MLQARTRVTHNKIINALASKQAKRLMSMAEPVPLKLKHVLYNADQPIDYIYFPDTGMVSVTSQMLDGTTVEVVTIGNEGVVGISALLGGNTLPFETLVQVPGNGFRIKADVLRAEVEKSEFLSAVLQNYMQTLFIQAGQCSACNRLHTIDQRCARWLLMTHDKVEGDVIALTQTFLAEMLGVRRATVNEVCGELRDAGLIEFSRGKIKVLDRQGLEATSCECYDVIKSEYQKRLS
jgi:CRP-like cAMP-binding protein